MSEPSALVVFHQFAPPNRASDAPNYSLRQIDIAGGQEIRRLAGHSAVVADVAFSPDCKLALSGSVDKSLILWDVVLDLTFAPDGQTLLSVANRHASELTCEQRQQFYVLPLCG